VKPLAELEVWFVAGAHEMYGDAVIAAVETHAREVDGADIEAAAVAPATA
jgi:L-arabinose isomerase